MTSIVVLRSSGVPHAILGRISEIVVEALDCVFTARTRTHIGKEQNEVAPSITYSDSACAIVDKTFDVRIVTSLEHPRPNAVFWKPLFTRGLPMFETSVSGCFPEKATARACSASSQVAAWKQAFFSTITNAFPQWMYVSYNGQKTKALSSDINEVRHLASLTQL